MCLRKVQLLQGRAANCGHSSGDVPRPWNGTTRAAETCADCMVGGSVALLLTARQSSTDVRMTMLWTLFVVLLLLWLLGVVSSYTLGGFIHLLLVLAVVAVVIQLISGRRAV